MHCETVKLVGAQQAKLYNTYKNTKLKLLNTIAAMWFNKMCRDTQLQPQYISFKINGRKQQDRSPAYLSKQSARTHTVCYAAASPHWLFTFLTIFKISDFNKEYMSSLRMIWMRSKHVGAFLSVLI